MFEKFIDSKKLGGVTCIIWKEGTVIFRETIGYRNVESLELMQEDTIFRIASMTKPVTSLLAMILYEEGKLNLTDPVTKWFPQFAAMKVYRKQTGNYEEANRLITVFDLLTHTAGFTYSDFLSGKLKDDYLSVLGGDIDSERTIEEWINGLAGLPLIGQPGELFNYGKSTDLLGILISTIEKKSLGDVMDEKIFRPLGMSDTFFNVPPGKKNRCASNIGYDESGKLINLETVPSKMAFKERPGNLEFEAGSGGLWSTTGDYLKFARLFVEKGCSGEIRLLKEETIQLMCTNQLTAYQREHSKLLGSSIFREDFGFGLGVAILLKDNRYVSMPCAGSVGSVGWPGAYGGWWSADPIKKSVSIFLTHSMTELHQLAQGIGFELFEAIDIFSKYSTENT